MERITNSIAEKIGSELKLDKERIEVIAYGTFALMHILLSIGLVILFGAIFGITVEALIISFTTSIYRKYSGGAHAITPGLCAAIGTIVCVGQAFLIVYVITPIMNLKWSVLLGLLIFIYAYYLVYKLVPVDSAAKPIKKLEKRERMKKGSIVVLAVYFAITVFSSALYIYFQKKIFLSYSLCIYGGTIWQSFTLTKSGHKLFNKIGSFYNQILNFGRREI